MKKIIFLLHVHLPYNKHLHNITMRKNFQECWFYEAVLESYLPLIYILKKLVKNYGVEKVKIVLNISPTILSMLSSDYFNKGFVDYLERYEELLNLLSKIKSSQDYLSLLKKTNFSEFERNLVEKEIDIIKNTINSDIEKFNLMKDIYFEDKNDNKISIISQFKKLSNDGVIEFITQPATHPLLPMYENYKIIDFQIKVGKKTFEKYFGIEPQGIWLPEEGYKNSILNILKENGIKYTVVEPNSIGIDRNIVSFYNYDNFYFFVRDIKRTDLVWDKQTGYPGNGNYREFFKDIGYDFKYEIVGNYLYDNSLDYEGETRHPIGIKHHKITNKEKPLEQKEYYNRFSGVKQAKKDAIDFLNSYYTNMQNYNEEILSVLAFDCELFGHWWRDGIEWLYYVMKGIIESKDMQLSTFKEYYLENSENASVIKPRFSSWGFGGYLDYWCTAENMDIWFKINDTVEKFENFFEKNGDLLNESIIEALEQMLREMLLLQSSDFPFIISNRGAINYARLRMNRHYQRFIALYNQLEVGDIDSQWLDFIKKEDDVFEEINLLEIYKNSINNKKAWIENY